MAERNIYGRMSDITAELSSVAKNLEVRYGKNSYKAVGEADVLAAVKPLEAKYGIYSYPSCRRVIDNQIMTSTGYDGKEKQSQFVRIETEYTFVNVDKPEERLTIISYGDGVDSQDKAPGKAMTYADKYALLKAYKIITGEDLDQYASNDGKFAPKPTRKFAPNQTEARSKDGWRDVDEEPCSDDSKAYIKQLCEEMGLDVTSVCSTVGVKMIVVTGKDGNKTKTFRKADFVKLKNHLEDRLAEIEGVVD